MHSSLIVATFALVLLPVAYAWGAAGHQIVATIAQMHLHEDVLPILCDILDLPHRKCHLASVASWADRERMRMRWSAALHYIGSVDDYPSETCAFPGKHKWKGTKGINVLDAVKNTTALLQAWVDEDVDDSVASEALKFLIHFVGDMHQPLHLTGRDRGGNSIPVLFDRRHTNLHSVWDTYLVSKAVRTTPRKYSRPLPYPKVEDSLQGAIYDGYIRRILSEGVLESWRDDIPIWLSCPDATSIHSEGVVRAGFSSGLLGLWESVISVTGQVMRTLPSMRRPKMGVDITPDGSIICPHSWAQPNHELNCEIVWPVELDEAVFNARLEGVGYHEDHELDVDIEELSIPVNDDIDSHFQSQFNLSSTLLLQLDSPEYAGVIADRMIVEQLLAEGGIRLAGILNYIFGGENGGGLFIVDVDA